MDSTQTSSGKPESQRVSRSLAVTRKEGCPASQDRSIHRKMQGRRVEEPPRELALQVVVAGCRKRQEHAVLRDQ